MPTEGIACFFLFISVFLTVLLLALYHGSGAVLVFRGIPFASSTVQVILIVIIIIIIENKLIKK